VAGARSSRLYSPKDRSSNVIMNIYVIMNIFVMKVLREPFFGWSPSGNIAEKITHFLC